MTEHPQRAGASRLKRAIGRLVAAVLLGYLLFLAYAMVNWPKEDDEALVDFLLQKAAAARQQRRPAAESSPTATPGGASQTTQPSPHDEIRTDKGSAHGTAEQETTRPSPREQPR